MSATGQGTPGGVEQEPAARSDEDRELAERLVAEAGEKVLDLVGPTGSSRASRRGCSRPVSKPS
jgi:hypothetical protein